MKMTLDMPVVSHCYITNCAYNRDRSCHARAITVGDGVHPGCDTFFDNASHTHEALRRAGVGACKVTGCNYNEDFECNAGQIEVGRNRNDIYCMTYSRG